MPFKHSRWLAQMVVPVDNKGKYRRMCINYKTEATPLFKDDGGRYFPVGIHHWKSRSKCLSI